MHIVYVLGDECIIVLHTVRFSRWQCFSTFSLTCTIPVLGALKMVATKLKTTKETIDFLVPAERLGTKPRLHSSRTYSVQRVQESGGHQMVLWMALVCLGSRYFEVCPFELLCYALSLSYSSWRSLASEMVSVFTFFGSLGVQPHSTTFRPARSGASLSECCGGRRGCCSGLAAHKAVSKSCPL